MKFKIYNGRNHFYQWDVNQKLIIEDYDPTCEIHFKSEGERCTLQVEPYELNGQMIVDIPNKIFQVPNEKVLIYVCYSNGERYTKENFVFDIRKRQKPSGYIYEEVEILSVKKIVERYMDNYYTKAEVDALIPPNAEGVQY